MCYQLAVYLSSLLFPQELRKLSEKQKVPVDLETYIKKLANSRKRILLVNDILQNVQVLFACLTDKEPHTHCLDNIFHETL